MAVNPQSAPRARQRRFASVVFLAVFCDALGGCSTSINGRGTHSSVPPRPSTSRAASTTPVSTIRAPWKQLRDSGTGIRFALPRSVKPVAKRVTAKDGTPVYQRVYAVAITPTFALSVAIVHSHQTYSAAALDGVANGLVAQLRAGGIKDAQVLERKQVRLGKLAALDFRLRFTPLDKTKGKSIWFVRVVADSSVLVLLQSIASPPPGATTLLATARAAQHKLVAGLRFP